MVGRDLCVQGATPGRRGEDSTINIANICKAGVCQG